MLHCDIRARLRATGAKALAFGAPLIWTLALASTASAGTSNVLLSLTQLDQVNLYKVYSNAASNFGSSNGTGTVFGDFNGDGYDDLLVGRPATTIAVGSVSIIWGRDSIDTTRHNMIATTTGIHSRIVAPSTGSLFGLSVAAGDINGDGYDDVVIGAPSFDSTPGSNMGTVYILYGRAAMANTQQYSITDTPKGSLGETNIAGTGLNYQVGAGLATGDFNADGFDDLFIGSPGASSASGYVYLIYGTPTKPGTPTADFGNGAGSTINLWSTPGNSGETVIRYDPSLALNYQMGTAVASGDINGDGYADIVMGTPNPTSLLRGGASVIYGQESRPGVALGSSGSQITLTLADIGAAGETRIAGPGDSDLAGTSVACGDVNADGFDDIVIGSPGITLGPRLIAGQTDVVFGSAAKPGTSNLQGSFLNLAAASVEKSTLRGPFTDAAAGHSVSAADVNADGSDDLLVGAPAFDVDNGKGYTYLVSGVSILGGGTIDLQNMPASGTTGLEIIGPVDDGAFGVSTAAGGDPDRRGRAALAIAGPDVDNPFTTPANLFGMVTIRLDPSADAFITSKRYLRDNETQVVPFGGRLSPNVRAFLKFGDGDPTTSSATVSRFTFSGNFSNLPGNPDDVVNVGWRVQTDRTGWSNVGVALDYLDEELPDAGAGQDESNLRMWSAPSLTGPWTLVENTEPPAADQSRNRIFSIFNGSFTDQFFALTLDDTIPVTQGITRLTPATQNTNAAQVVFQVTLSEAVVGLTASNFTVNITDNQAGAAVSSVTGGPTVFNVTVDTMPDVGAIRLDLDANLSSIADDVGNEMGTPFTSGESYFVDRLQPAVNAIPRLTGQPAANNLTSVSFEVQFTEGIAALALGNFSLTTTGDQTGASLTGLNGNPGDDVWTVDVATVPGEGTIQLNLDTAIGTVLDAIGNSLQTAFTTGEVFSIDRLAPEVQSIIRPAATPQLTNGDQISFELLASESITGVTPALFDVTATGGQSGATVAGVAGALDSYIITVDTMPDAVGEVSLSLQPAQLGGVLDSVGNPLSATIGVVEGYSVDRQDPVALSIVRPAGVLESTSESQVVFEVLFSEPVTGLSNASFNLVTTGDQAAPVTGAQILNVSGSGDTYQITVATALGTGTVRTDLVAGGAAPQDAATNQVTADKAGDEIYAVSRNGVALVVDTTEETIDGDTSSVDNLAASPGPDGVISLPEAVEAANATPGTKQIEFSPALSGLPIFLSSQLTLTGGSIIIDGGASEIIVSGIAGFPPDIGFEILSDSNRLSGLTINNFNEYAVVISGASSNVIQSCIIGTNAQNDTTLGNGISGVHIENGSTNNLIGGNSIEQANVIAVSNDNANGAVQIRGVGTNGNTVLGNFIGLSTDGTPLQGIENLGNGVVIENGAQNNTIGSTIVGAGNTISHNVGNGVVIRGSGTSGNFVYGNYIGTNANTQLETIPGPDAIFDEYGNQASGVFIHDNASNNTIGGTGAGAGNYIWNNLKYGIEVDGSTTTGNIFRGNSVRNNALDGILLTNGANGGILPPVLDVIENSTGSIIVGGSAPSNAIITFYVDEGGEGQIFLPGTGVAANVDGIFDQTIDLTPYIERNLTATATISGVGTSAFSAPKEIAFPPSITPTGPDTLECGDDPSVVAAFAQDDAGLSITEDIITGGDVLDANTPGLYTITYDVTDSDGLSAPQVVRTVTVEDTTAPVTVINGASAITLECGVDTYTELGATATDTCDGSLAVVVAGDTVDPTTTGTYIVTYNVADNSSNAAVEVTRVVTVADTIAPVITLNGPASVAVACNGTYTELGATVTDACDSGLAPNITNAVDTTTPGVYTVTYNVTDAFGNSAAQVTRTVNVTDTTPPVLTLTGAASQTVACGGAFTDPGATATDTCDGTLTPAIIVSGTVNTAAVGVYTLTYNVTDGEGNAATSISRTVNVTDTTPPVLSLTGAATQNLACGAAFTDPGATATDVCDGNLTPAIVVTGTVDTTTEGVYTLTYNVVDGEGNAAVALTRTVNIGSCSVPVVFNDPNLEAAVRAALIALGLTLGPDILDTDLVGHGFTDLTVNEAGITDLTGLEFATDLRRLFLRSNDITDLTPLADLDGLITLDLTLNPNLSDLTPISGLPGLLNLFVSGCDISDLSPLSTLTTLISLHATSNQISSLSPLAPLSSLQQLRLDVNEITVIASLAALSNLTDLRLSQNQISNVGPLTGLSNLTRLDLQQNNISDINSLANNNGLASGDAIDLSGNPLTQQAACVDAEELRTRGATVNGVICSTEPVITLNGLAALTLECGTAFVDPGATANDPEEGDITSSIVKGGDTVNPAAPGVYTITYNVQDATGLSATQVTRTVTVADTQLPVITLNGAAFLNVQCGSPYVDAGATATDACSGNLTSAITVSGTVNTAQPGSTSIQYRVVDSAGNVRTATRSVTVVDGLSPVITLNGNATVNVACGAAYTDAGATATDACSGTLTSSIVRTGTVVTASPGTYLLRYNVSDGAGRAATEVRRTVNVVDSVLPVITLNGAASQTIACGTAFTDPGATATDTCAGSLTSQIVVTGSVNVNSPGTYTLRYNVADAAGNAATQRSRTITVTDNVSPVINLLGDSVVTLRCGEVFTDPGASAIDTCSGNLSSAIEAVGFVDTDVPGEYTRFYTVEDASGNSTERTRTVRVLSTDVPRITLAGATTIVLACGASFVEPGATAMDDCGNVLAVLSDAATAINKNKSGGYLVEYTATDGDGNTATALRSVVVNCGPVSCSDRTVVGRTRFCLATIDPAGIDADGDGLEENLEDCLCTSDENIDSDSDGIADNFETRYPIVLDPSEPGDALCDPDGDGLSNVEEFFEEGDPQSSMSPRRVFWLAPPAACGVASEEGSGTLTDPWTSITFAIQRVQALGLSGSPVRLNLLPGDYCEAVNLLPGMVLATGIPGDPCSDDASACLLNPAGEQCRAKIFGSVNLANNSALIDLDLAPNLGVTTQVGAEYFLATVNNARARVDGCRFSGIPRQGGNVIPGVYGVRALGLITRDATIENSDFNNLYVGIVIAGDIPAIRRNHFRNMQRNAIWILARAGTGPELTLGSETDPTRGWNAFDFPTIAESVVQNDRQAVVLMENNDWSTNTPGEIDGIIVGPADFEPFLAEGTAIFAASMFCTVWAADDQERILNARLDLRVSTFGAVSQNVKGVYGFPAIGEGRYTITAQAAGFARTEMTVDVLPGDFASVTLAMKRTTGEGEGEGEGEDEGEQEGEGEGDVDPPPPGCCESQGKMSGPPLGDGFVGALTLGVFLGAGLLMRRREEAAEYTRG